uniref:Tetratricopeptide repeat protein 5 OB fold domain-containing protein n=1 Tax=Chromera velia CCMP2878 TaxID=1169474 RepID=A0A0G4GK03_9ALVE|eukprot:Cvel_22246.t1-p1 / transcript=Cvel_22246.t1 / gene=Cvel_22246 / organism=Chromera_velia_CCMP2878 / gene_product=Tetratricopeptide repeat protein 5, putative / transcript_product=Tetratricopeptide repeat protein 5, putative / location=Cvel_scaffold2167:6824-14190(+) / protein_length=897 / sequence_SO=supercontig / SO=protein_coding / is_pseudo=false
MESDGDERVLHAAESALEKLYEVHDFYFAPDKTTRIASGVQEIERILDEIPNDIQHHLSPEARARCLYFRGKALDAMPEYSKLSEELLSKAVKLNPQLVDCWNSLGNVFWKKQDLRSARRCFEQAIEICGNNAVSLRRLSIVMRMLSGEDSDSNRGQVVRASVEKAKAALALDVDDPESWYVLGNSYLANFFENGEGPQELNKALMAYAKAEQAWSVEGKKNPDLYVNRATVKRYQQDYAAALEDLSAAQRLDPSMGADESAEALRSFVNRLGTLVRRRGNLKSRQLSAITEELQQGVKSLARLKPAGVVLPPIPVEGGEPSGSSGVDSGQPTSLTSLSPGKSLAGGKENENGRVKENGAAEGDGRRKGGCASLGALSDGTNPNGLLLARLVSVQSRDSEVPVVCVCCDPEGAFFVLSLYHIDPAVASKFRPLHDDVVVKHPVLTSLGIEKDDRQAGGQGGAEKANGPVARIVPESVTENVPESVIEKVQECLREEPPGPAPRVSVEVVKEGLQSPLTEPTQTAESEVTTVVGTLGHSQSSTNTATERERERVHVHEDPSSNLSAPSPSSCSFSSAPSPPPSRAETGAAVVGDEEKESTGGGRVGVQMSRVVNERDEIGGQEKEKEKWAEVRERKGSIGVEAKEGSLSLEGGGPSNSAEETLPKRRHTSFPAIRVTQPQFVSVGGLSLVRLAAKSVLQSTSGSKPVRARDPGAAPIQGSHGGNSHHQGLHGGRGSHNRQQSSRFHLNNARSQPPPLCTPQSVSAVGAGGGAHSSSGGPVCSSSLSLSSQSKFRLEAAEGRAGGGSLNGVERQSGRSRGPGGSGRRRQGKGSAGGRRTHTHTHSSSLSLSRSGSAGSIVSSSGLLEALEADVEVDSLEPSVNVGGVGGVSMPSIHGGH